VCLLSIQSPGFQFIGALFGILGTIVCNKLCFLDICCIVIVYDVIDSLLQPGCDSGHCWRFALGKLLGSVSISGSLANGFDSEQATQVLPGRFIIRIKKKGMLKGERRFRVSSS